MMKHKELIVNLRYLHVALILGGFVLSLVSSTGGHLLMAIGTAAIIVDNLNFSKKENKDD